MAEEQSLARPSDEEARDVSSGEQRPPADDIDGVLVWSSMDLPGMDGAEESE
jgi:hypothetical protein